MLLFAACSGIARIARLARFVCFQLRRGVRYLVMRKEQMHDLLLPRGRSIYHQIMEKLTPMLEKEKDTHPKIKALYDLEDRW